MKCCGLLLRLKALERGGKLFNQKKVYKEVAAKEVPDTSQMAESGQFRVPFLSSDDCSG